MADIIYKNGKFCYRGFEWVNREEFLMMLELPSDTFDNVEKTFIDWILSKKNENVVMSTKVVNEEIYTLKCENGVYEYRGFHWKCNKELSLQMGFFDGMVSSWLNKHKDKSITDLVDAVLNGNIKKRRKSDEMLSGEYAGYTWKSFRELSEKLGKTYNFVSLWLSKHKEKTVYDCIDAVIKDSISPRERRVNTRGSGGTYKEYSWRSLRELTEKLGKQGDYVSNWLHAHPSKTVYDCIDYVLDRQEQI